MLILDSKVITYILSSSCLPEKDVSLRPCQETQPLCRINLFIVTKDKLLNIFLKTNSNRVYRLILFRAVGAGGWSLH